MIVCRGHLNVVSACVALALVLAGCAAGGPSEPGTDPFPPDRFLKSWMRDGEPVRFPGAELYGHINGGAEVFLELGFERLDVQRFTSDQGSIAVELYRMSDALAALGIYLMKCGDESTDPTFAARHTVNRYQLQLVGGSVYALVNRLDGAPRDGRDLVDFARHVAERLPEVAIGGVFDSLPEEARIAGSERIIRGPFTLEGVYTLGEGDVLRLAGESTAVAASYDDGHGGRSSTIVAPYPDPAAAQQAFAHLVANLDSYLEVVAAEDRRLVFRDYAGLFGVVVVEGSVITLRVRLATPDA